MLQLFEATGAHTKCREAVEYYSQKAFKNLEDIDVAEEKKRYLHALAVELLNREQ